MKFQVLFSHINKKKYLRMLSTAMLHGPLTLVLLNPDMCCFANSVDPDQLASEEANWSGSALFKKLSLSMWIYINNQDQVIWSAEN